MNVTINDGDILSILRDRSSIFHDKFFVCLPSDEDLSKLKWDSQDHQTRKVLLQSAHFLFTNNRSTIEWGLGKKSSGRQEFINEFKSIKPAITGSDAHSTAELFHSEKKNYLWIKADPTFEGLRQVLCEPDDRVAIQESSPESKLAYHLIEKVRFVPKSTEKIFPHNFIELNAGLNAIIGGKSSGKSLLLYHIAKTVDFDQVKTKHNEDTSKPYSFLDSIEYDFEVVWKDGEVNRLRNEDRKQMRNICYIPQMFVNNLVEDDGKNSFHSLILETLLQNEKFVAIYQEFQDLLGQKRVKLGHLVNTHIATNAKLTSNQENQKRLGDRDGVTKQSSVLTAEINQLEADASVNETELVDYKSLVNQKEMHLRSSDTIRRDNTQLENLLSELDASKQSFLDHIGGTFTSSNIVNDAKDQESLTRISENLSKSIEATFKTTNEKISQMIEKSNERLHAALQALPAIEQRLEPYVGKISNGKLLAEKRKQLQTINDVLRDFQLLEKQFAELSSQRTVNINEIWDTHEQIRNLFEQFIAQCAVSGVDEITPEARLNIGVQFKESEFNDRVVGLLDKRTIKSIFGKNYDDEHQKLFDIDAKGLQKKVFDSLNSGVLKSRTNATTEDVVRKILDNYLSVKYNLKHKEEDISHMSPGKRGLIVLQLILHLSNSQSPILIDQPEDNLDNRTIFDDLTTFIKQKKVKRQIIIVTHNANLVVSADAEEVIVANQNGMTDSQLESTARFEYLSGALENISIGTASSSSLSDKGIMEHVCEILEGGREAFRTRQKRYSL